MELKENNQFFVVKTANECLNEAKLLPIPKMLFDQFWIEGEICILFADTNRGKSVLAVQIGDSISKGIGIQEFKMDAIKQPVLYFDFELSPKQFEYRYSDNYAMHYKFSDNFSRVVINSEYELPPGVQYEDYLNEQFENIIIQTGVKVLIVDNLTFLKGDNETAKEANPFMKHLKKLKSKHSLSMLILAHTPKRDSSRPLTVNDIQGSKMLANFMDSSFAIGCNQGDNSLLYLKQIKVRNGSSIYNADNVPMFRIDKKINYLLFEFISYSTEYEHLKQPTDKDRDQFKQSVLELHSQNLSYRKIAEQLNSNAMTVKRLIDKL